MTSHWILSDQQAALNGAPLTCSINVAHSELGLHQLSYRQQPIELTAFQLSAAEHPGVPRMLDSASINCFVRDEDLVADYPETSNQPFSAQIYWRAWRHSETIAGVDLHLSLQTTLLESFPRLTCKSLLATGEALWLGAAGEAASPMRLPHLQPAEAGESLSTGVLVRPRTETWSYLESIQAADDGGWTLEPIEGGRLELRRSIGGEFQEKGVIRRYRLRACLLPRSDDLVSAHQVLEDFALQPLPLTA